MRSRCLRLLLSVLLLAGVSVARLQAAETRTPTKDGLVYGTADGQTLTMDYYAPLGKGPHPIAIIIHGGGYHGGDAKSGSEAYVADFLAPAGYAVFSVNYRLAPAYPYPYMVQDVQRAVRFIRYHARSMTQTPTRLRWSAARPAAFSATWWGCSTRVEMRALSIRTPPIR